MAILPTHKSKRTMGPSSAGRFLLTVNISRSAGPIRFIVKEGELVSSVIETALLYYAREGRRPILGSHVNDFVLYCSVYGSDVLKPGDRVWSSGSRRFELSRKQQLLPIAPEEPEADAAASPREADPTSKASGGAWKSWLNSL